MQSIELVRAHVRHGMRDYKLAPDYEDNDVSRKVVRIIQSYRDYVMRTVLAGIAAIS